MLVRVLALPTRGVHPGKTRRPARNPDPIVHGLCGAGAVPMRLGMGLQWDVRRFAALPCVAPRSSPTAMTHHRPRCLPPLPETKRDHHHGDSTESSGTSVHDSGPRACRACSSLGAACWFQVSLMAQQCRRLLAPARTDMGVSVDNRLSDTGLHGACASGGVPRATTSRPSSGATGWRRDRARDIRACCSCRTPTHALGMPNPV